MNEKRKKTPINTMLDFDLNTRLTSILQQAYHRRSRNQPANLNDIVETLNGDLLKTFPDCPIETIDDAIVLETLHNPDTTLSPTFFFNAVKKAWFSPKTNAHQWDGYDEDLAYWRERRDWLANHGQAGTPQHKEACEMVEHYLHGDTEQDTLNLLDACAAIVRQMDERKNNGTIGDIIASCIPTFDAKKEFDFLVGKGQLSPQCLQHFLNAAIEAVNSDRLRDQRNRVERSKALDDRDVLWQCQRLAVLDWLRSCNTNGVRPSIALN